MAFDTEDLCDSIKQLLTDGNALNNKIAAIEAEKTVKGKGLTPALESISNYFFQSWSDEILNCSPAIFYGVEDISANDGDGAVAKTHKVFIEVVFVDNGQRNDGTSRVMRYARAVEEVINEAFSTVTIPGRIKIETVRPMSFRLSLDSSEEVKVGGVSLTVTLV